MSLTYLGHSAFKFKLGDLRVYADPYIQEPMDWRRLEKADIILLSHGHFDHGVLMAAKYWEHWKCKFVAPTRLIQWMQRKHRKTIPQDALIPLDHGQSAVINGVKFTAIPAHHPTSRIGTTIHAIFMRSSAPGNPVNGYFFEGYYHAGDTLYTADIAEALKGLEVHTACLPIGGKYKIATPQEALRIAEEIGATRVVPMHWQPLVEQVPFKYRPSHLVKHAKAVATSVIVCPLAIGEKLELHGETHMDASLDPPAVNR